MVSNNLSLYDFEKKARRRQNEAPLEVRKPSTALAAQAFSKLLVHMSLFAILARVRDW
jgi:hypothetical protein